MADYKYGGTGRSLSPAEAEAAMRRNSVNPAPAGGRISAGASQFPFREIAEDGGVWKLDPAAFLWRGKPTKPQSIRTAASKYAIEHGMRAKTVIDDGMLYIQFKAGAP